MIYKASLQQLIDILGQAGYTSAIAQLENHNIHAESIETIEIDYQIEDKDTEDEHIIITEFNIYLPNTIFFGVHTKHCDDMDIQWSRRNPFKNPKELPHG